MNTILPFFLPMLLTSVFTIIVTLDTLWIGPLLLPLLSILIRPLGKFSTKGLLETYHFFHHNYWMQIFKRANGIFFIIFQLWIVYIIYKQNYTLLELLLIIYTTVLINSNFAITLAHDLMHSKHWIDRKSAKIILLCNGFFYLEADHLYTHHKYVGTAKDPASALIHEHLYAYLFRSISTRFLYATGTIQHFPKSRQRYPISNIWINFSICIAVLLVAAFFSTPVLVYLIVQFVSVTIIYEVITYIQHYGLRRKGKDVTINDAWNCYYKVSSYLYFMMPVHSIHHLRQEPDLNDIDSPGPEFPRPFAQMFMSAFLPPLWFKWMYDRTTQVQTLKKTSI